METIEPKRAEAAVTLTNEVGLHARPAVRLTQEAAKFDSRIELSIDDGGQWYDAKSVVKVMRLKAKKGSDVQFRAEGVDADRAIDAIVSLVERRFGEE
jgi:phosphocarrier protein